MDRAYILLSLRSVCAAQSDECWGGLGEQTNAPPTCSTSSSDETGQLSAFSARRRGFVRLASVVNGQT